MDFSPFPVVRNRVYHARCGRWLQADPLGYADSYNLYQYCHSSPANYLDPTGKYIESGWDIFSIGVGLASVGLDIYNIATTGEGWGDLGIDALGLGVDLLALALPVPGGASIAIKAYRAANAGSDISRATYRMAQAVQFGRRIDAGVNAYQSGMGGYHAYDIAANEGVFLKDGSFNLRFGVNALAAVLGSVHLGTRGIQLARSVEPVPYRAGGVTVVKQGDWWVKSVDPTASRFMRWWGEMSIASQYKALERLKRVGLAPEFRMVGRGLHTRDVGEVLAPQLGVRGYLTPVFWRSWLRGSWALGTVWNDIRPRNMSRSGVIFDPAYDPLTKLLWQLGIYGSIVGGGVALKELTD